VYGDRSSVTDEGSGDSGSGGGGSGGDADTERATGEAQPTKVLAAEFEMKASFSARWRRWTC
jgi:hypothetical protein